LRYGFVVIEHPTMVFQRDTPTSEWIELVRSVQSQPISIMWRPKGGDYAEGKTTLPWLGTARKAKL
ncbi:hypothetical protein F4779DRAFT_594148, partial [Xylariaceae sp. FL0662B]